MNGKSSGKKQHSEHSLRGVYSEIEMQYISNEYQQKNICHNQFPFSKQFNVRKSYSEYAGRWLFLMPLLHNK